MDKSNKNIIEAGITHSEFESLFADEITMDGYLSAFKSQRVRYAHLADLAAMRDLDSLEDYFFLKSGQPKKNR